MTILEQNLKFLAPERLTDADDGGGMPTGVEIVDGQENNLFDDVSEWARVHGEVSLREFFPAVDTDNTETFFGANLIIDQPPSDPNVSVVLFSLGGEPALRAAARDWLERYVVEGPITQMKLLGNHVQGSKLIRAYQLLSAPLPEIGEVFVLSEETGDTVIAAQFVRVQTVEHHEIEMVDDQGSFFRREIILGISDELRRLFPGGEERRQTSYQPPTRIRRTSAVDAARYYGIVALAQPAAPNEFEAQVETLFQPLLPGATGSTPVLDVLAGGEATVTIAAGARTVEVSGVTHSDMINVTLGNRDFNYTRTLRPPPAARTVRVTYRSGGRRYTIADESGTGSLTGAGSGLLSYVTGSLLVTLAELPDVDSAIIIQWGSPVHYTVRASAIIEPPEWVHVTDEPIEPGTLVWSWEAAGQVKMAVDDGNGNITGDAVGAVLYSAGQIYARPVVLPDPSTTPVLEYESAGWTVENFTPTADGNGFVTVHPAQQITPGSVVVEWETIRTRTASERTSSAEAVPTVEYVVEETVTTPSSNPLKLTDLPTRPFVPWDGAGAHTG